MNLAFVVRAFGGPGGTEKVAADLAGWLAEQGHEVHVYCARAAGGVDGVRVHRIGGDARGWRGERAFLAASREVPRGRHDLIQGFGLTVGHDVYRAGGGVHAAWLDALGATGAWGRLAAWLPRERWAARLDREAARSARRVVCNSARVADEIRRRHGVDPGRVRVVRNGVDGARFRPDPELRAAARARWGVPDGGRVALFLGTGFRRKGLAVAARAFRAAAGPGDRLVVIGRDSRFEARIADARRVVGHDRLVAHGPVSDPERWLPGADATVLPTLYDASANSTLEALACGVPAVTSGRDGASEVVPDAGLVVADPRDVAGFAAALDRAWSGGTDLASRCREEASAWTVARSATAMLHVYDELIHG